MATVNVVTTEGGVEALRTLLLVQGKTLAEMTDQALVFHRGSQLADSGPEFTSQPRFVACGAIR